MQIESKKVWEELTIELGKLDHMKQSEVKFLLAFLEDTLNACKKETHEARVDMG